MTDYIIELPSLFMQTTMILIIYHSLSQIKVHASHVIGLTIITIIGNFFFSYFFFILIIFYLFLVYPNFKQNKFNMIFFYSIFSLFTYSVFGYFITVVIYSVIDKNYSQKVNFLLDLTLIPIFPVVGNSLVLKLFKPNLDFLRKNQNEINQRFILIINILLTICCTIQFTGYWIEKNLFDGNNPIRLYMIAFFIAIISTLLIYLNRKTKELDRRQIAALKDDQLAHLTAYIQQVETMYDEIRSFRHDYHNVLISLRESLNTKDLNIIETNYDTILRKEGITVPDAQFSLAKLNNIRTLPIKGVLSNKIFQAWQKKIQVQVEIEDIIENEAIDGFDYVRIVSILLDNAIEAAEKADSPWLSIVFLNQGYPKEIKLIIDNTCSREAILMDQITEKGYSTKGDERGLGLFNIRKLLEDHSNVFLQTESNENIFRQTLIIKEQEQ